VARYSEHYTDKIYQAAEAFRTNCLLRDGSLLFENASVWRPEVLDRIHNAFVATPDEGDRSFVVKFKDQIGQAGQEVIRLAAEILCVYFLFPSNVGGARKRQVVREVLGWAGDSLPESHLISGAFSKGIGSGGQGYNTRRPFEIAFLIDLVIAWKKLPAERQVLVASDPWLFQEFIDSIEDAESKQLRHMLLYLLYPNDFERIASGNHKRRVITAFSGLIDSEPEDEDRAILPSDASSRNCCQTRNSTSTGRLLLRRGTTTAKARPRGRPWRSSSTRSRSSSTARGKTFRAKKLAERVIRSAALSQMGPARYFQSQPAVAAAIEENVRRLQLHPAYS